ncbi:hypothetical protein ACTXT7_000693 [Hymenolepis weldensis]
MHSSQKPKCFDFLLNAHKDLYIRAVLTARLYVATEEVEMGETSNLPGLIGMYWKQMVQHGRRVDNDNLGPEEPLATGPPNFLQIVLTEELRNFETAT